MSGRRFTDTERAEAIALAAEIGAAAAGRRLEIPASTIRNWTQKAGDAVEAAVAATASVAADLPPATLDDAPESTQRTLADRGRPWQERAAAVAVATSDTAVEALAHVRLALADGRHRHARELAVVYGILTDKAMLLSGAPTRISESKSSSVHVERPEVTVGTTDDLRRLVEALRAERGLPPGPGIDDDIVDAEVVDAQEDRP